MRQNRNPGSRLGLAGALSLCLAAALASGCGRRSETAATSGSAPARNDKQFDVGMIFDVGGRGDKSFNDSAYRGLEQAKHGLDMNFEIIEPADPSERESGLRLLAKKDLDLIIAVGFMFSEDVARIAREFPDKRFACVDYAVPAGGDSAMPFNLRALNFREEEGCFLVGALAGYSTRSGRIGFIGGMDSPIIRKFEKSFTEGVRYANPRAEVGPKYVGSTPDAFKNPARAKELALGLYDAGADIIFQAAGASGLGVFQAAKQRSRYVIGTDADQWDEAPGLVLTSMVKHVDRAVYETIRSAMEGSFKGGVTRMGLLSGGIELVLDDRNANLVSPDIRARLDAARRAVMSKQIEVLKSDEGRHGGAGR